MSRHRISVCVTTTPPDVHIKPLPLSRLQFIPQSPSKMASPDPNPDPDYTDPQILQAHISTIFAPLSTLTRLSGGFANSTYRGFLANPLPDGAESVIIKHAAPLVFEDLSFLPVRSVSSPPPPLLRASFFCPVWHGIFDRLRPLLRRKSSKKMRISQHSRHQKNPAKRDKNREVLSKKPTFSHPVRRPSNTHQFFESTLLHSSPPVPHPKPLHYSIDPSLLITSDAGAASTTLKALLLSGTAPEGVGRLLGRYLRALHTWGRTAASVRETLRENVQARQVWEWATYGRLSETVSMYAETLTPYAGIFSDVAAARGREEEAGEMTVLHGDFWTGNVVLPPEELLVIIDWEMARLGGAWEDLAQMCAELFLPDVFCGGEVGAGVVAEFLREYGGVHEEAASRLVVHFGVHLVVWPPRIPAWGDAQALQRCVRIGAEFVEKGWKRDWEWVRGSVLGAVVDANW
jgi:aminoglycoside phosphotransferase (APT) family kinase protein